MATALAAQKPPQGQKMPQAWSHLKNRPLSTRTHREKCRHRLRPASGAPVFANGAVTAAMAFAFNQLQSGTDQDTQQFDDEGFLIGGFSPVGGEFLTDQGELVSLAVSDFGTTLVDAQGSHFNFSPETGLVHRLESGALQSVAPEVLLGGGVLPVLRIGQVAITGFTRHGLNQVISRGGVGVNNRSLLEAVRNPLRTRVTANGTTQFQGANATVVVNRQGQIVTAWPRSRAGHRIQGQ